MAESEANGRFVYEFGDFVVDPKDKTVLRAGRNLQLPPKEFDTLLLLIENNGSVVTKAEMMSALWGETFVEEGNLPTYISRLRKVINLDGERVIETVPKLGYRFNAELRKTKLPAGGAAFVETASAVELPEPDKSRRGRGIFRIAVFGIAAISVIVIAAALYFQRREKASPGAGSIAVLPMRAMSPDDTTRSLALGLADAVISKIGTVHGVIVRPTSAVARFADSEEDSLQIGKRLNVDMVLEATLQQSEGRWRINARLLRTATGEQVWAEKYDEADASLFDVEDKLAAKIANTLAFELTVAETRRLARKGTGNPEAYEKYLRGRYYQRQNTPEGLARSLELYQQAVVLDPNFADAYAGIADADLIKYNFGISPPSEVISGARQSVKRALDLSPDLSDAYTSLAMIQFLADHDWSSAESSLQKAISLNPNNTDAYHRYGYFLANMGQFDQALEKFEMARRVDPLSPIVQTGIGLTYLYARKFPEAIDQLQRVSADNPDFSMPVWFLSTSYECSGDAEKAFEASLNAMTIEGSAELASRLRIEKEKNGVRSADELWLKELLKAEKEGKESPINIAWLYATLGDKENAIMWLEKAYSSGDPTIAQIKFISKYDFLRDDPRFQGLVGKLGF